MIKLFSDDLDNFKFVGSGRFGKVYKVDDNTAYKIYYQTIANDEGIEIDNPVLFLSKSHFNTLLKNSKNLKYSGGIKDIIYMRGGIGGVSIPYYEGNPLLIGYDKPLRLKIDISKQLVRSGKDLTNNHIYPLDYRFKNIILNSDKAYIVDLDDGWTRALNYPSIIMKALSVHSLSKVVVDLLGKYGHLTIPFGISHKIGREKMKLCYNYKKLESHIEKAEKEKDILYVDESSNINKIIELCSNHDYRIVYLLNEYDKKEIKKVVDIYNSYGLKIYDFYLKEMIDKYPEVEVINEAFELKEKQLTKVYKYQKENS